MIRRIAGGAVLFLALVGWQDRAGGQAPLRVGYMICNSLQETRARFGPLTAHLEEQLGRRLIPAYLDTADFEEAVRAKSLDLIHTNSYLYVWFREVYGFRVLAGERRGEHGAYSSGGVIARKEGGVRTLADLRGKRFVFGPPFAPTAYITPYWLLLEAGIDPEKDLGLYRFASGAYQHEKVIYAVLNGAFDAGAGPALDLELMVEERKIDPEEFVTLAQGPLVPYCVFSAAPSVDAGTFRKLQSTLLSLTAESVAATEGEVLKVLKSALVDGFVRLREEEFETLRAMVKRCNLPPFAEY